MDPNGKVQTVKEHCTGVASRSAEFASAFGAENAAYYAGMAHDIGKCTEAFQQRLRGGPVVDHSTAGAYECLKRGQVPEAFAVAGHHGGLPNGGSRTDAEGGTLWGRVRKAETGGLEDYSAWKKEISLPKPLARPLNGFLEASFYTRMLYSCLVDADYLDTEAFFSGEVPRGRKAEFQKLNQSLDEFVKPWAVAHSELDRKRNLIRESCIQCGESSGRGLFTLTVPTGGGKTIASLAFALRHAQRNQMSRIIYVIPYTSIIDQTAQVFRKVLGEAEVLEHHSGVTYGAEGAEELELLRMRATENWDMPVVITTSVQFFESLFSNRPGKCRKLHNIANSVIVFDEAQMLPLPYLCPCVQSISELVKNYNCSAVLCTATQPALNDLFHKYAPTIAIREICPRELAEDSCFSRVVFREAGCMENPELAAVLRSEAQVLCIVNSRKKAAEIYEQLPAEDSFHLSTLMMPAHRKRVLKKIRERLRDDRPCRVVATSLIEAGVDVDFPKVFREEAGLDSILQAGGRCNREGKREREESIVQIFHGSGAPMPLFAAQIAASRSARKAHPENLAGSAAVKAYFEHLLKFKGDAALDRKRILSCLCDGSYPFADVAEAFKLIESDTYTVYIPTVESRELLARLRNGEHSKELYRSAAQFAVAVYEKPFQALEAMGALDILPDGSAILTDPELYSEQAGLSIHSDLI